ncbi:MAG: hypothetical protein EPN97_18260 [Alphaproteobacteria bacterium]|nr:MAG: hypothetical protein EPN97_18260 [Alphaproteobacteria bacterium]
MKKYFTIAAVLGVIAFASVSFLAQADQQSGNVVAQGKTAPAGDPSDGEAAADNAAMMPVDGKFDKDDQDCSAVAATPDPKKNGAQPTDAQREKSYKKCMIGKGHSQEELKAMHPGGGEEAPQEDANDQGERVEE